MVTIHWSRYRVATFLVLCVLNHNTFPTHTKEFVLSLYTRRSAFTITEPSTTVYIKLNSRGRCSKIILHQPQLSIEINPTCLGDYLIYYTHDLNFSKSIKLTTGETYNSSWHVSSINNDRCAAIICQQAGLIRKWSQPGLKITL